MLLPLHDDNPLRHIRYGWWTVATIAACVLVFLYQSAMPEREGMRFVYAYGAIPSVVFGIDALPPKQQTAIVLYYLHGYSLAEAAEIAECNVGTMKSRLHYALKALRARLPIERRLPVGAPVPLKVSNR